MTTINLDTDPALLVARRSRQRAYRTAFRRALSLLPAPEGFVDALALADHIGSSPETPREMQITWQDMSELERLHPDVLAWAPLLLGYLGLPEHALDAFLDVLFDLAMAIEAQDQTGRDAALGQLMGLVGA